MLQRSDIQLLAPVLTPEKVVCVGMNYRDHCMEQDVPIPSEPIIFNKFPNAITGPYDDILLPSQSQVRVAGDEIKKRKLLSNIEGGCFTRERVTSVLNISGASTSKEYLKMSPECNW